MKQKIVSTPILELSSHGLYIPRYRRSVPVICRRFIADRYKVPAESDIRVHFSDDEIDQSWPVWIHDKKDGVLWGTRGRCNGLLYCQLERILQKLLRKCEKKKIWVQVEIID